jgi:acid stress-induced BolA-like protein IbaG/YrbA
MEPTEVRDLIQVAVPEARVAVEGEGCSFSVVVLSDDFEGVPLVKRQQQVLNAIKEPLSTGALHAITVKAHTPAEWETRKT